MKIQPKVKVINELLIRNGWSRREFAKKANIGQSTAFRLCGGFINPNPRTAKKVVEVLGVEFDEIFEIQ